MTSNSTGIFPERKHIQDCDTLIRKRQIQTVENNKENKVQDNNSANNDINNDYTGEDGGDSDMIVMELTMVWTL